MTTQRQHVDAILEMRVDSFHLALEDLDPISRALIELSVVQGLDDGEIASMLGNDESDVRAQREDAMRRLAQRVDPESAGAPMPQIEATVARALEADSPIEPETEPEAIGDDDPLAAFVVPAEEEEPEAPHLHAVPDWLENPEYEPRRREKEQQPRKRVLFTLLGLLVVLAVIVGVQRAGGSGNDDTSAPAPAPSPPAASSTPSAPAPKPAAPAPKPNAKQAKRTAVGNSGATGTVAVANGKLTMNVKGLPEGNYTVWLYNSVIDSKPLGKSSGTTIKLNAKLPADAKNYKYIDVSLQPADGNPNHSGQSVLRTPTP
jgi:hypothetical protein